MNNAVFGGIRDALAAAETDNEVAVAVITGEGRAFSAGQDLQPSWPWGRRPWRCKLHGWSPLQPSYEWNADSVIWSSTSALPTAESLRP